LCQPPTTSYRLHIVFPKDEECGVGETVYVFRSNKQMITILIIYWLAFYQYNLINHYLKSFEEEQRKRQAGEYTSRTNRNFDSEKSKDYSEGI
jgi:predicted alpha-1,6-mannanase (GH76 family)